MQKNRWTVDRWLAVLTLLVLSLGCSVQTKRHVMVEVRYLEIPVADLDRAVAFYEAVFEVKLERATVDGYSMAHFPAMSGRVGADVTLAKGDVYLPSKAGAIVYFHVANIDAVISRATARWATVLYAKRMVSPGTWVAEFEDSEGNRIALSERDD